MSCPPNSTGGRNVRDRSFAATACGFSDYHQPRDRPDVAKRMMAGLRGTYADRPWIEPITVPIR
jgi:hypothetical protein